MLVGIINNETLNEHYFIHLDNNDLSIIHVNDTNTEYLSKDKAINLVQTLLSSNLTYKEKENDYDIYLDEANNKRYFKDGKENYFKFLENNGVDATYYLEKINKRSFSLPKRYKFIVNSIIYSMILTSVLTIPLTGDIRYLDTGKRILSDSVELKEEEMINLMRLSPFLNEEDTNFLCNEDYLKLVLSYSDTKTRNFYLREKLHNINIKYYDKEKVMHIEGYYQTLDINTIHIAEQARNDEEYRKIVMAHEFIHLTQCDSRYVYLIEATAEILRSEFYGQPVSAYKDQVTRTKILMELIGPEPILNCIFKGDNRYLESELSKYLSEEDTKEFLQILSGTEKEGTNVNEEMDELLNKIYEKQNGKYIRTDAMMSLIYDDNAEGRIYFNYNDDNYYRDYQLSDTIDLIEELDINDVINSNNVELYNYPQFIPKEKDGEMQNIYTTISTKDFSSIPINDNAKVDFTVTLIFKDGTLGYVTYDRFNKGWGRVRHYKIEEQYAPSISKKFNTKNTELDSMLQKEEVIDTKKVL